MNTRQAAILGSSLLTPDKLPGLAAWYSADYGVLSQVGGGTAFASASSQHLYGATSVCETAVSEFTASMWFNADNVVGVKQLINKATGASSRSFWVNLVDAKIRIVISQTGSTTGANVIDWTTTANVSASVWNHLVVILTGGVLRLFLNGTEVTSFTKTLTGTVSTVYTSSTPIRIASYDGTGSYMQGKIDETALWCGTAISDTQVTWLYNSGQGRTYSEADTSLKTNLVSWWSMNAPASGDWQDQNGSNHLTPSASRPTATEGVTFAAATDGQTVRRWLDRSGNGRHLDQATLANQPALDVAGSAKSGAGVKWTAGASHSFNVSPSYQPITIAIAVNVASGTNVRLNDTGLIFQTGGNWVVRKASDGAWGGMDTTVNCNTTSACLQLQTNNASIRAGTQTFADTTTTGMPAMSVFGSNVAGGVSAFGGSVAEMVWYDRTLTDSEWAKLQRYLNRRHYP